MIDLTFVSNGHPNGIGPNPFFISVGTVDYAPGWIDYFSFTGANVVPPSFSVVDGLYNAHDQLLGTVHVQNDGELNGTLGMFVFYPNSVYHTSIDEVLVNDLYPRVVPSAVPEASTWIMCLMGFAMLAYVAWRRPRSLKVRATPHRL